MADVSRHRGDLGSSQHRQDLGSHPDVPEMQARYAQMLGGRRTMPMDGPLFLVGLYCAISPWVIHFSATQPSLMIMNLIAGVAIGLMALAFTIAPERTSGLGLAMSALGVWLIIAPWIVGSHPDKGIIISNAVIGGLTILLGMACAGIAMKSMRHSRST
ncbi:SPW repeat protein [Streptomyces sp. NPDC051322]|uniref:SPW repeat protein n=1 Tax=Streptomyces sp. NPDC051322 TaxID=3154645 RepID=UPI00344FB916